MDGPAVDGLTIEDLAHESSVPVSTVRMYQARGLLPPPTKRGRVGYYGPGHLARMRLIGRLQEEGFSLASIKHLADAWEDGRGLTDVLGLEAQIADWDRQPTELKPADLAAMFEGAELTPELLERSQRLGLLELTPDGVVKVADVEFLRVGTQLVRLGVPPEEVLDEYEQLQGVTREVAGRFVALFERHFLTPAEAAGFTPEDVRHLTAVLDQLRDLGGRVVSAAMRHALTEAATNKLSAMAAERRQTIAQ
jgi:DNA-binding transcriptional MerR regulator